MIYCWVGLAVITLYLFARQKFLLSPTAIFFGYFAVIYPISYLVPYWLDMPSFFLDSPREIPAEKVNQAFFLVCLGLASFCITRFFAPVPRFRWKEVEIIPSRCRTALVVSLVLAVLAGAFLLIRLGGVGQIISNLGEIRSGELKGLGVATFAVSMLVPTVMQFWLITSIRTQSKHVRRILAFTIASALLGGLFGFRGPVAVLLIQTACIWYLMTGKLSKKQVVVIAAIVVLLASVVGVVREATASPEITEAAAALIANTETSTTLGASLVGAVITRTRAVQTLIFMTDYIDRRGETDYHYFADNVLETALSIVPSFVIADIPQFATVKSYSLGEKVTTTVYSGLLFDIGNVRDTYGGISYGLIAEGYWNLGALGVVIVCALLGLLLRVVEDGSSQIGVLYIVVYKSVAGFMVFVVEAPQTGTNGTCTTLLVSLLVLAALSFKIDYLPSRPGFQKL